MNKKRKIFIELPTWIGDCIMATPSIENISKNYGNPEITFAGPVNSLDLMRHHPNVHDTVVLKKKFSDINEIRKYQENFDLFFSFRGSIRSNLLKFFVLSDEKFQFNKGKYNVGHQVEKYNNFINDSLNINSKPGGLKIYKNPNLDYHDYARPTVGINPGASYGSAKRWSPKKFSEVALMLSPNYDIVIFGGPKEIDIASDIESELTRIGVSNFQNFAGKIGIDELVHAIAKLDLFITGDSGPMHIAAAFKIPTVSIFGPTKDNETSQWMNPKSAIVKKDLDCQPCMKRTCPLGHHNCMSQINAKDVFSATKFL